MPVRRYCIRITAKVLGHEHQNQGYAGTDEHKTPPPPVKEDQPAGRKGNDELASTGAHLYDTGHKTPSVGKPAGDGGQGDDVDGTEPHTENDAIKEVKLPEGGEVGHEDTAQAQQNCRDCHELTWTEAVVQPADNHPKKAHDEKGQRRCTGNGSPGPAEFLHQWVKEDAEGDKYSHPKGLYGKTDGRDEMGVAISPGSSNRHRHPFQLEGVKGQARF